MTSKIFIATIVMRSDPGSSDPGNVEQSIFLNRSEAVAWIENDSNFIELRDEPDSEYNLQWCGDYFTDLNEQSIYWGMISEVSTEKSTESFINFSV